MRAGLFALAAAAASKAAKAAPPAKKISRPVPVPAAAPAPAPAKPAPAKKPFKPSPVQKAPKVLNANSVANFRKLYSLSPSLVKVVDVSESTRQDVLKRVWVYIKAQKLQDAINRREIICDEKLRTVFGQDRVNMFEIVKLLGPHITKKD